MYGVQVGAPPRPPAPAPPQQRGPPPPGYPGPTPPGPAPGNQGAPAPQTQEAPAKPSPVVERSKVVYSAPPVRIQKTKPKEKKQTVEDISKGAAPTVGAPGPSETMDMELDEEDQPPPSRQHQPVAASGKGKKKKQKEKGETRFIRTAAGQVWEDPSLKEWNPDDFRIFCGDLGNETTDEVLARAFMKYPSFQKAKVIRDKKSSKTRGYGFVSFKDPNDYMRAMREMNGKYVGNRPIKLRKSNWRDRDIATVVKKVSDKHQLGMR